MLLRLLRVETTRKHRVFFSQFKKQTSLIKIRKWTCTAQYVRLLLQGVFNPEWSAHDKIAPGRKIPKFRYCLSILRYVNHNPLDCDHETIHTLKHLRETAGLKSFDGHKIKCPPKLPVMNDGFHGKLNLKLFVIHEPLLWKPFQFKCNFYIKLAPFINKKSFLRLPMKSRCKTFLQTIIIMDIIILITDWQELHLWFIFIMEVFLHRQ